MMDFRVPDDEPCYVISVAAQMLQVHPQTLRRYEALGLVCPVRLSGKRLYSPRDVDRVRKVSRLMDELGVNLAGVQVILDLTDRVEWLQQQVEQLRKESQQEREAMHRMQPS